MRLSARAEFEKVTSSPSASFTYRRIVGKHFAAPYHYHPEMELTWIVHSSGHRFVGDHIEPFNAGDLVLLGSNLPHVWLNHPGCARAETVVVQFLPEFLGHGFFDLPEMSIVRRLFNRAARGVCFSPAARKKVSHSLSQIAAEAGPRRLTHLLEILATLGGDRSARVLCSPRYAPQHDLETEARINAVYRHLVANFRETIFQSKIAASVGLSPAAFSRFFRHATGRGFTETLNDIRLGHACELLRETGQTVAEACYASGFENLANFNRQFRRRHGLSPTEWRMRIDQSQVRAGR
jgi:AraC-like DNA-binding protein